MSRLQIGARLKSPQFQVVEAGVDRRVVKITFHVKIFRHGFKTDFLPQSGEGLNLREVGGEDVALELQQLEFDLEQVAFAHVTGFEAGVADFDGLLKAVVILLGEFDGGLCEQNVDELLRDIEGELALAVGDLRARYGGRIFRGLEAVLTFFAAFEKVANADVELRIVLEVVRREVAGLKNGDELRVPGDNGIGAEVCGDFLGLILKNGGAQGQQRVIVLQGKANRFVKRDARRSSLRSVGTRRRWGHCRRDRRRRILLSK